MDTKQRYRQQALERRRSLRPELRTAASNRIQDTLLEQLGRQDLNGHPMLIYRAMKDEVDTRRILSLDRSLMFAPVSHGHDGMQWHEVNPGTRWQKGLFDVEEPLDGRLWEPASGKAVLVCPLTGFDRKGNRLGLGLGCFDRWLSRFRSHVLTIIGLGFACQEVPVIPAEAHDVPLDCIITEHEVIECRNR